MLVGDLLAFSVGENEQGRTDLNGDGQVDFIWVMHVHNTGTGITTNLALAGLPGLGDGNSVAFSVFEWWQGAADLNGDGDAFDAVAHVFDASTGSNTNLGLGMTHAEIQVDGNLVAFPIRESIQGNTDLNGDGDSSDAVLHVVDLLLVADDDTFGVNVDESLVVAALGVLSNDVHQNDLPLTVILVDAPSHGVVHLAADGSFTYVPEPYFTGDVRFTYRATDGQFGADEATVTITVNPVVSANDETFQVDEDTALVGTAPGLLANDEHSNGRLLSAELVDGPSNGNVVVNTNGSFTYTPNPDFNGEDSFTYRATDGQFDADDAIVMITIAAVNDAPRIDLNGPDEGGVDFATTFVEDGGAVSVVDADLTVFDVDGSVLGAVVTGVGDVFVTNLSGAVTRIDRDTGTQTVVSSGAMINQGLYLAVDNATGELFVADGGGRKVVKVDPITGVETVVASGGSLIFPVGIEVDHAGDMIISDLTSGIIRIDRDTGLQSVISAGGKLSGSIGMVIDADGHIVVANASIRRIVQVDPDTGVQTIVSEAGRLSSPMDVAVDTNGDILVAGFGANAIIRVDPVSGAQTVISSGGNLSGPFGIALDVTGDLLVTSLNNSQVVRVDPVDGTQTVLSAGNNLRQPVGIDIGFELEFFDIASATVKITNAASGSHETLSVDVTGTNIAASYDSATATLSLTGDDTLENYQQVLRTVTYDNAADNPDTTPRIIELQANDGDSSAAPFLSTTIVEVIETTPPEIEAVSVEEDLRTVTVQLNDDDLDSASATATTNYKLIRAHGDANGDGDPFNDGDEQELAIDSIEYDPAADRVTLGTIDLLFADHYRLELDGDDASSDASSGITDLAGNFVEGGDFAALLDTTILADPALRTHGLIDTVLALNLHQGTQNSLVSKLEGAKQKLEDGNPNNDAAATGKLNAFINEVQAQRGKKISEDDADALIAQTLLIIELLEDDLL